MMTQTATRPATNTFTPAAWQALLTCRRGLQGLQGRDLFGDRERAQLRFLFWLYHSGHPVP